VWQTRKGRKLSAAGGAYWEKKFRQGFTDGRGHISSAGIGASTQARVTQPKPLPPRAEGLPASEVPKARAYAKRKVSQAELNAIANAGFTPAKARQAGINVPSGGAQFVLDTAGQLGTAAYNIPAAGYYAGEAVTKDVGAARRGDLSFKQTRQLGKGLVTGTVEPFKHPIRDRGFLLVNLLGAAGAAGGTAARLGAAGKAAAAARAAARATGEGRYVPSTAGRSASVAAAKALTRKPEPATRTLQFGDLQVHPETSKNPTRALVQRARDKRLQTQAAKVPGGRAEEKLAGKV